MSSASVVRALPPAAEPAPVLRRVTLLLGLALLVAVQRPSIHEIWFVAAHILLLVLAGRRSRIMARAIAARPPVARIA